MLSIKRYLNRSPTRLDKLTSILSSSPVSTAAKMSSKVVSSFFFSRPTPNNGGAKRYFSASLSSNSPKIVNKELPPDFVTAFKTHLPNLTLQTNYYDLQSHGRGESYHPTAPPVAIVTPKNTKDISILLPLCQKFNVPVIPYGAGTSVEGHVCATSDLGTISLDMKEFQQIGGEDDDDGDDLFITVGAGITRLTLNESLRHTGMQFMVDPGADATIGGMVACGASGTTAVRYGTMRENILGLECVLPNGTIVSCGTKGALKSSAGYDLTSLLTGSEGTLAVITKVTVKLHPIPQHVTAARCTFNSVKSAAEAVAMMRMCSIPVERCELLDSSSVEAFQRYACASSDNDVQTKDDDTSSLPPSPTLFLEFTGPSSNAVQEQVELAQSICQEDYEGSNFEFTTDEAERKALWAARHKLYYASLALRPGATSAILTDACVPLSKFAEVLTETVEDVQKYDVVGPCFGHAGDGNFHCILPLIDDGDSEEYIKKLFQVNDNLIRRTIEAGGTCTGEHGIGYGKMKYLKQQYGDGGVEMMKMVKKGLDPCNIMNPGKVVAL